MRSKFKFKKFLLIFLLIIVGSALGFFLWLSDKYVVPILVYHHVDGKAQLELTNVSPESFEIQMAYLKKYKYNVLHLDELVETIQQGKKLPRRSVVITFDDGYDDNFLHAFPILKKYNLPATFFIATDLIGTEGFMTWDQVRLMVQDGMDIGSHTRSHIYLPTYPSYEKVKNEIEGSKQILEKNLGIKVEYFCYPTGGFNEEIKQLLKEAGYQGACTTNRGMDRLNKDVYELKRIRMKDNNISHFDIWAKLSGYYNFFRRFKQPSSRDS